jgi:hypothetical protein
MVQAGLGILDTWVAGWQSLASTIVSFNAPSGPREFPSIGLLCEADLTKPDIIETAADDPK